MDFLKASQTILDRKADPVLELITLAPSGGGKSYLAGTSGLKTLFLHGLGENHGFESAKLAGGDNIIPVCWDLDDDGQELGPDQALSRITQILKSTEQMTDLGIEFVVVDGATELETLIKKTTLYKNMTTHNGKHNPFKVPEVTLALFNPIMAALKGLAMHHKIGYNMTCILDVKEMGEYGDIVDASPKLYGYHVAEGLIQQFPDILVVSRVMNPETEELAHRIQFMAGINKVSKDETGAIRKSQNFTPRLSGVSLDRMPPHSIAADLSEVLTLKQG